MSKTPLFKTARVYQVIEPPQEIVSRLDSALQENEFTPCTPAQKYSNGWVPPVPDGSAMTHTILNRYHLVCLQVQEKEPKPAAVRDLLDERVLEWERKAAQRATLKVRRELHALIMEEWIPKTPPVNRLLYGYLDALDGLIVLDVASAALADDFIGALRGALGGLRVTTIGVDSNPANHYTSWLRGTDEYQDHGFTLGYECVLRLESAEGEQPPTVKFSNEELDSPSVREEISCGKRAYLLGLQHESGITFRVDDKLVIKGIRYSEEMRADAENFTWDDAETDTHDHDGHRIDADMAMMCGALSSTIASLGKALGGFIEQEAIDLAGAEDETSAGVPDEILYQQAVDAVCGHGAGSVTRVQRALGISHEKAARYLRRMEDEGVVGALNDQGVHPVLNEVPA